MEFWCFERMGRNSGKLEQGGQKRTSGRGEVTDGVESPHERKKGSRTLSGRWAAAENTHGASLLFSSRYTY